jgi:hypothetical protein
MGTILADIAMTGSLNVKIHIQSGSTEVEIGARYAVSVRSPEFGDYDFEGTLTDVDIIEKSAYSGNPGFYFLGFGAVSDRKNGELIPLDGPGRGARDFTIARLTRLADPSDA